MPLAKPTTNGRPWSLFPSGTYTVHHFDQPLHLPAAVDNLFCGGHIAFADLVVGDTVDVFGADDAADTACIAAHVIQKYVATP